jgi:putative hemolysin
MNALFTIVLAACMGVSFFLSGMEAGVFVLSRFRLRRLIREGNAQARLLHQYLDHTEGFLWTIVIGNTLANFVATAAAVTALRQWLSPGQAGFWAVFIPGGLFFYALCDLLPKMLFRLYPTRLCLLFLRPFHAVDLILKPLVWLLARPSEWFLRWSGGRGYTFKMFGTRDELKQIMEDSAAQMTTEERAMISRVLDLQTLPVSRVMTPMAKGATLHENATVEEALALCRERGFSRLPVWEEKDGHRRVAGLIHARSLLYEPRLKVAAPVREHLRPALFLDEGLCLEDAMRKMQRSGQPLAIVLSGQHREVGVVSLQDILQKVFGEFKL